MLQEKKKFWEVAKVSWGGIRIMYRKDGWFTRGHFGWLSVTTLAVAASKCY